ncbi:hypothetical protein KC338_g246 [Hortaea werneckii]|nr:hypothetical protein KC338_g246 [Hortaea werneckii]
MREQLSAPNADPHRPTLSSFSRSSFLFFHIRSSASLVSIQGRPIAQVLRTTVTSDRVVILLSYTPSGLVIRPYFALPRACRVSDDGQPRRGSRGK